ncbi:MAG: cohesin domain-containing protein, partial [Acidobacteriota bacterium]
RLKDGETNLLAGLIRQDDTASENGVPGLSEIPVLGRLFSKNNTENRRTDVILTLTPHIVRLPDITETDLLPIWVGTEQNITFRGGSPRVESDAEGPFDGPDEASPEEIRERIRERLQSLPRGLRDDEDQDQEQEQEQQQQEQLQQEQQRQEQQRQQQDREQEEPLTPGQELVPGLPPPSSFEDEPPPPPPPGEGTEEEPPDGNRSALGGTADLESVVDGLMADATTLADVTEEAASFGRLASVTSSPLAGATDVELQMTPAELGVAPGDTFEVTLSARALAPVSHLPLTVGFDPEVLTVERVEAGSFLGSPEAAEVLSDTSTPGRLVIGASRLGDGPGVAGEGPVVRVVFRAVGAGAGGLRFEDTSALDSGRNRLTVRAQAAEVRVGSEEPPERPERPTEEAKQAKKK